MFLNYYNKIIFTMTCFFLFLLLCQQYYSVLMFLEIEDVYTSKLII